MIATTNTARRTTTRCRRRRRRRRGTASVLAMLYLVLFGTLALGFYASTNTQMQIVANDERAAQAYTATESGMDFMRFQLARVSIPSSTPASQVINELYNDLKANLEGTNNLGGGTVSLSGNTISIPAGAGFVRLDSAGTSRFRATITDWLGEIVVKVDGRHGDAGALRAISMDFTRAARPINAFDYAVASKGKVTVSGGAVTSTIGVDPSIATVMSAIESGESIKVTGGTIGGDLNVAGSGTATVTGGSVGGSSIPAVILADHVHTVGTPEFPEFDTNAYRAFATNVRTTGANGNVTIKNVYIPANSNPKFNGNATLEGIMFIASPNKVDFQGTFNLKGFVVFENTGDPSGNQITFTGDLTTGPVPNAPEFDALRATSGVAILAPTAKITFGGNAKGNLRGSLITSRFESTGNQKEIVIDQGTLMTLDTGPDSAIFGSKTIRFSATGANNLPTTGMIYSAYYRPNPTSYQEVMP
jgi:hypothetical protein